MDYKQIDDDETPKVSGLSSAKFRTAEDFRNIIKELAGVKFILDCGHPVTFGYFLGNNVIIYNGKEPKMVCTDCGY